MSRKIDRRLLRVNLSTGDVRQEVIAEKDIEMYYGGRLMGNIYMYRELAPGIDPLSPENKLFFSTGALTGTSTPGHGRYIVHCKSPLTGLWNGALAGGYFGPELRKTGYDMLIIEGKADRPVYLVVTDDSVKIKDAGFLWGLDTLDTQEQVKEDLHDQSYRVACIGPAGENKVCYAGIVSERRIAGRAGAGAVMGSKNLKAIAVKGTKVVEVADPEAFKDALKLAFGDLSSKPDMLNGFRLYGTTSAMPVFNENGITPWRNWLDGKSDRAVNIHMHTWRDKYVKKDVRCSNPCPLMCSKIVVADEGRHAGVMTEGPDYETLYSLGTCCDVDDPAAVFEADALCDRFGLDTMSTGLSISFAMECFEKGILTAIDTGGDEIYFGRGDLLPKLIRNIAYTQGFGAFLALGTKKMSEQLGQGTESFAMHCKGLEIGGYDPRGAKSLALIYSVSSRGGCHKSAGAANGQALTEIATGKKRFSNEGKANITFEARRKRMLVDSGVLCSFPGGAYSLETILELFRTSAGYQWSMEELMQMAERGCHIERAFNVREGVLRDRDILPKRLLEESPSSGSTVGSTVELEELLDDYYQMSNWDIKTGIPDLDRLRELGLPEIAKDMEAYANQ